ncbi:MAG: FixH family protein [Bacteroidetes bacterium]|nr:FixH family protein [Bacteroidota bacterium]
MSWGTKIAIFYGVFMVVMISLVVMSTQHKFSLVTDEYYEQALDYEDHIIQTRNSAELEVPLKIEFIAENKEVNLSFPQMGTISGDIHLYRPSSQLMDQHVEINTDEAGLQTVSTRELKNGLWRIKVKWEAEGKTYFDEENIFIP